MLASPLQSLRHPGGGQRRHMTGIAEPVEGSYVLSGHGNIIARPSRIVAFGPPRGEDHDNTSATLTCDAVALARLEREQRSWPRVNDVAARLDPRRPSTTISQARSRTWWSPSSLRAPRRTMIARAPSTVSRTAASRVPSGA
jgi:hypothetical protein